MSSSSHDNNNNKNNILVLGKDFAEKISGTTVYAEGFYKTILLKIVKSFV